MKQRKRPRPPIARCDVLEVIDYLERSRAKALDARAEKEASGSACAWGYPYALGVLEGSVEIAVEKLRKLCGEGGSR